MNTIGHGLWVYYLARKSKYALAAVGGAIFPDLLYSIPLTYYSLTTDITRPGFIFDFLQIPFKGWGGAYSIEEIEMIKETLYRIFSIPIVHWVRLFTHSYIIWGLFMIIAWYLGRRWLVFFGWGWLSHIVIDMLTHVEDALPYFFPIWNRDIEGIVSYWDPGYHGTYFATANYLVLIVITFLMIQEWWRRRRNEV